MINILYLVNKDHVQRKMSRVRFHSIAEIGKQPNIKLVISGKGWPDYDNSVSVSENIDRFQEKNNVLYDFIMCYKPEELIEFRQVKQPTIIRYNEMYDREKVYQEICDFKPNIVICHHQNDYIYYKNYFLDNKLLDDKPHFYHIPHCVDRTIFKDYGYKKKYDITFSGALGNSILDNH